MRRKWPGKEWKGKGKDEGRVGKQNSGEDGYKQYEYLLLGYISKQFGSKADGLKDISILGEESNKHDTQKNQWKDSFDKKNEWFL